MGEVVRMQRFGGVCDVGRSEFHIFPLPLMVSLAKYMATQW